MPDTKPRTYFCRYQSHVPSRRSDARPKRLNRGQGGAAAQLAAVAAQIRPDLRSHSKKQSKTTEIHKDVPVNAMAPAKQGRGVSDQSIFVPPLILETVLR